MGREASGGHGRELVRDMSERKELGGELGLGLPMSAPCHCCRPGHSLEFHACWVSWMGTRTKTQSRLESLGEDRNQGRASGAGSSRSSSPMGSRTHGDSVSLQLLPFSHLLLLSSRPGDRPDSQLNFLHLLLTHGFLSQNFISPGPSGFCCLRSGFPCIL